MALSVPDMSPEETYKFWRNYSEWQGRVTDAYRQVATDPHEAALVEKMSLNLSDMINAIPYTERHELLNQHRQIIRFDEMMQLARKSGGLRDIGQGQYGPLRKFVIDKTQIDAGNPLAIILNRMNIQHDPLRPLKMGRGGDEAMDYFGANIPSTGAVKSIRRAQAGAQEFRAGKKVFIFDTETTGLATDVAGVREVGGGMYHIDASGTLKHKMMDTAHFRTARMETGSIWRPDLNKLVTLGENDALDWGEKNLKMVTGSGDEFAEKLVPFLKNILDADHIAGHNVEFDLRQTLMNLMRTGAYKDGREVAGVNIRSMVDQAVHKVGTAGHLIDTRELLMQSMPRLGLAKELEYTGKLAPFSLENVMLQTNLSHLMVKEMGADARKFFVEGAAQHSAEYDTTITAYMLKYLSNKELKTINPKRIPRTGLLAEIRANTIKAGAKVPSAHIKDFSDFDPRLFRQLIEEKSPILKIHDIGLGRDVDLASKSADEWITELGNPEQMKYMLRSDMSFMEQSIWASRQGRAITPATGVATEDIVNSLGQWRDVSGLDRPYSGMLNQKSTVFKMGEVVEPHAYADMVDSLAAVGNPFADLSMQERTLTSGLARASRSQNSLLHRLGKGIENAANVADDLGIIHFAEQTKFSGYKTVGANVAMPLEVLKQAERQGMMPGQPGIVESRFLADSGDVQMLKLSPLEKDGKFLNLSYELSGQEEADRLANWVSKLSGDTTIGDKTLADFGLTDTEHIRNLAENIRTRGTESGINIGYMEGPKARTEAYDLMEDFFGSARDRGRAPIKVSYITSDNGAIRAGPAMLDRNWGGPGQAGLRVKLGEANNQFSRVAEYLENGANMRAYEWAQTRKKLAQVGEGIGDLAREGRWTDVYDIGKSAAHTRTGKGILAGAAIGLGAYYMFRRKKERDPYMEPFDTRPIENSNPPPRIVDQPAPQPSRLNPMATGNLVSDLNENRTNHALMGPGKYSSLYGGAI